MVAPRNRPRRASPHLPIVSLRRAPALIRGSAPNSAALARSSTIRAGRPPRRRSRKSRPETGSLPSAHCPPHADGRSSDGAGMNQLDGQSIDLVDLMRPGHVRLIGRDSTARSRGKSSIQAEFVLSFPAPETGARAIIPRPLPATTRREESTTSGEGLATAANPSVAASFAKRCLPSSSRPAVPSGRHGRGACPGHPRLWLFPHN